MNPLIRGGRNLSLAALKVTMTFISCFSVSVRFISRGVEWKLSDFSGLPQRSLSSCYDGLYMFCCKWKSCYAWVDQAAQMFSPLRCHTRWDFRLQEQYLNCALCVLSLWKCLLWLLPVCWVSGLEQMLPSSPPGMLLLTSSAIIIRMWYRHTWHFLYPSDKNREVYMEKNVYLFITLSHAALKNDGKCSSHWLSL